MGLNYRMYGKVQMGTQFSSVEFESGVGVLTNDSHLNVIERQVIVSPAAIEAQDIAMYTANQKLEALIRLINQGTATRATSIYNYVNKIYSAAEVEVPMMEFIPIHGGEDANFLVSDRVRGGAPGARDITDLDWIAFNTTGRVMGPRTKALMSELFFEVWREFAEQLETETSFDAMRQAMFHLVMSTDADSMLTNQYIQGLFWLEELRIHLRNYSGVILDAVHENYLDTLSHEGHNQSVSDQYLLWYTTKLLGRVLDTFPKDTFFVRLADTTPNYRMYLDLKDFIYLMHTIKMIFEMVTDELVEMPNLTVWYAEATNRRWSMAITPPRREINWELDANPHQYRGIALHPWRYDSISGVEVNISEPDEITLAERERVGTTMPIGTSALGIKQVVAPNELTFNEARDASVRIMESTSYAPVVFSLDDVFGMGDQTVMGLNVNTIGSVIQALYPDPYRHAPVGESLMNQYRQHGNILWDYAHAMDLGARWPNEDVTSIVPIVYS